MFRFDFQKTFFGVTLSMTFESHNNQIFQKRFGHGGRSLPAYKESLSSMIQDPLKGPLFSEQVCAGLLPCPEGTSDPWKGSCAPDVNHLAFIGALCLVFLLITALFAMVSPVKAQAFDMGPFMGPRHVGMSPITKKTLFEARVGALLGYSELRIREGDNPHVLAGRRNVDFHSWIFSAQAERFITQNLAVRAQGWINIPPAHKSDFFFDGGVQWRSTTQYLAFDLAGVLHFGRGMTPYSAGLIGGYRFNYFDIYSERPTVDQDEYKERSQVHIPYIGVYYAHSNFLGGVARFDLHASPLAISTVKGASNASITEQELRTLDGHSLTGIFFDSFLQWSIPISESFLAGAFARYEFLELHSGATVNNRVGGQLETETHFSMDSRFHKVILGLSASFTF